jgi:hypothetical protein
MASELTPQVRYQDGTLERMPHKKGPDDWMYRWIDHNSWKRRRGTLGTVKELRPYRLSSRQRTATA